MYYFGKIEENMDLSRIYLAVKGVIHVIKCRKALRKETDADHCLNFPKAGY